MTRFDAIVIGAGAGGGIVSMVLAERGLRVLILERGRAQSFADTPRDHLRNHRHSEYGHNTGPDLRGNPRVYGDQVVRPHEGGYNNNASAVGGGTLVYGGQAWRFHPLDFRMASTYGVPEGSSLVDWPFGFEELAPYYERVEWEIGVSGNEPAPGLPAKRPYPMPGVRDSRRTKLLRDAADELGLATQTVPLLVNTVPRDGRPACAECQLCVGFACPVDAKNGTQNTALPRALRAGATLKTETVVGRIEHVEGRITGVDAISDEGRQTYEADRVFVCAGAIESARLLLLSGLGNEQVGRNLQGHYYSIAYATTAEPIYEGIGPGVTIATTSFNHGNDGIVGGGMLADDFIVMPVMYAKNHRPPSVPAWGQEFKDWIRYSYPRALTVGGPVHEIPSADCRVTLAGGTRDRYGLPVARLTGTTHPETVRTANFLKDRAVDWARAAGAVDVWTRPPGLYLSAGQHQAGTCRMGDDPRAYVTDRFGRVHGTENLFVADASLHPTNGGFNPVLTVMAMAWRVAELAI